MGKTEILLLIASVAIGIALMVGMVIPIMKDGKDMVETRNLAQEMSAAKDKFVFNLMMKTYDNGDYIKVGGTNFLEASGDVHFPYKAKNTGVLFSDIFYFFDGSDHTGVLIVDIAGSKVADIDFENSEVLKTICSDDMIIAATHIYCYFSTK